MLDTELIERVRALIPMLADEAAESERLRRPTDAAIRALEDAGVFRQMIPRSLGGDELDLDTFLEVGLLLGEADTSIAWVANFCVEHNFMLCQFPEAFQREIFAARTPILAPATIAPTGSAVREGGAFRLSGRWSWASGVMHASWVLVAAPAASGELTTLSFFALPIEEVRVEDVWFIDGMEGTGSNDIVIEDALVPAGRSASMLEMASGTAEGSKLHEGPLYRTPLLPILMLAASMPVVGRARAVVRDFRDRLDRQRMGSAQKQGEKASQQMRLARVSMQVHEAELLMRDVVRQAMALRNEAAISDRAHWGLCLTHAVHKARGAILEVADSSGASAHFRRDPLQRAVRDANVASCHVAFDLDARLEMMGRVHLGLDPGVGLV